jgi:hypothetical protein
MDSFYCYDGVRVCFCGNAVTNGAIDIPVVTFYIMEQERSYNGSNGSTEPGPGDREGPAYDRQLFFFLSLYFAFIFLYVFFLSLYFAFTQIVTDARSNKHAHVTMGYFEFL